MDQEDRNYIMRLFPAVSKIEEEEVRNKVIQTWVHAWGRGSFRRIEDLHQYEPARESIAYTNVDHTNQVARACDQMASMLSEMLDVELNLDYLLAGVLLHDVDKLVIFDAETGGFTEMGRQVPHAVAGGAMARAEGLPEEVAHIIEAHSTKFSPHPPRSLEALIVRHADLLVANAVYMARGLEMDRVLSEALDRIKGA